MKNKSGYLFILITILFMCAAFIGCGNANINDNRAEMQSTVTASSSTVTEAESGTTLTAESSQITAKESSTSGKAVTGSQKNSTQTTVQKTSAPSKSTEKSTNKTTTQKTTTVKAGTTSTSTTKKAVTKATTASTLTCTVEIECKKILNNMDKLSAGHEEYVPANGMIMSTCSVTVENGDSVYDALKTACNKNGVSINAQNSAYGTYIAGFNNLDEKDCGKQSGWLYSVNGKTPPKSCDKYTVSDGDVIVFSYTC